MPMPLRYAISDWTQAVHCKSNTSEKLHIKVGQLIDNIHLTGTRIRVIHDDFGTIFSYVLFAKGDCVQEKPDNELSYDTILDQLYKYGFDIEYRSMDRLDEDQVAYLRTVKGLNMDKLRTLSVKGDTIPTRIVVFNVEKSNWLDNMYQPSMQEFVDALTTGLAIDITEQSKQSDFVWDWLNYVADIDDILAEFPEV